MHSDELFDYKRRYLGQLFFDGFVAAYYSHEILFSTIYEENSPKLPIALTYLAEAHSYFVNAETFYVENNELFDNRSEISKAIHKFDVYNKEFMDNVRTDHSHQWSDIEFRSFVESFVLAKGLLNIDEDNYWVNLALSDSEE